MTEQPPIQSTPVGAFRFNTDSAKLEYFNGDEYVNITTDSPEQNTGGTRGLWAGRNSPHTDAIDFVNIDTTGDASDFGNLVANTGIACAMSSRVRGVIAGGTSPSDSGNSDKMDFVTIASTGNATDFGNLITARHGCMANSNSTRGLIIGGRTPSRLNSIEYITIAATGNAVDFGDASDTVQFSSATNNQTRGLFAMGNTNPAYVNSIEFVTMSTLGNSSDFGDLTTIRAVSSAFGNAVRGVFSRGEVYPGENETNVMDFVTFSTLGNAQDFGDSVSSVKNGMDGGCSSPTRGCSGGGSVPGNTQSNNIDYVQIMTTGNAFDFGDLNVGGQYPSAFSNGHGGLG